MLKLLMTHQILGCSPHMSWSKKWSYNQPFCGDINGQYFLGYHIAFFFKWYCEIFRDSEMGDPSGDPSGDPDEKWEIPMGWRMPSNGES